MIINKINEEIYEAIDERYIRINKDKLLKSMFLPSISFSSIIYRCRKIHLFSELIFQCSLLYSMFIYCILHWVTLMLL